MVELGDAPVAGVTVLGPQRSPDDTCRTELVKVECLRLSQLKDRLQTRVLPYTNQFSVINLAIICKSCRLAELWMIGIVDKLSL